MNTFTPIAYVFMDTGLAGKGVVVTDEGDGGHKLVEFLVSQQLV